MSIDKKANESNFRFFCAGLAPETFQVVSFDGEEAISQPYAISLALESANHNINPAAVVGCPATFFLSRGGKYYPYSGVVRRFDYRSANREKSIYHALLVPRLLMLEFQYSTSLNRKMSYPDAVKKILDANGLSNFYTMDLSREYPVKDHIQQEGESDFNLVTRLMAEAGIWFFFKEPPVSESQLKPGGSSEKMVITDKAASFLPVEGQRELLFRGQEGMVTQDDAQEMRESVHDIVWRQEPTPGEVVLKNYYSETPETQLLGRKKVKGGIGGKVFDYTTHDFKTVQEGERAAEVEANRYISQQVLVSGTSNCRGFRAGLKFSIAEHPRTELNSIFVLQKVTFSGGHTGVSADYANSFEALPAGLANSYAPQKTSMAPKNSGMKLAVVEAGGSEYPLVDAQGRYKIRYCEDTSDAKNAEASKDVRMLQQMAGAKSGVQFPLREGTVVSVAFVNGDPDRPLIVGAVPNASTVPPVTGSNKTVSIMRDAAGNEYLMDSDKGKEKIHLLTPAKNIVELNDGDQRACLQSKSQDRFLLDDKNTRTEISRGKHTIVLSAKSGEEGIVVTTAGGHVIKVDDKNKSITIQSKAGSSIQIDDNKKSIVMTDANKKSTVTLDGSKGLVLSTKGDLSLSAVGKLTMTAASVGVVAQSGTVDLNAKAGALNIAAMGAASLASKTGAVDIKGMNVNVSGTQNVTVKANMNAKVSGTMGVSIDGMKADVKGTIMTSVSGTIVKIN